MTHHVCNIIPDLRPQYSQIESDYVNTFYAMYMKGEWGIDMGYIYSPWPVVSMKMELVTWQRDNDCGALCTLSLSGDTF